MDQETMEVGLWRVAQEWAKEKEQTPTQTPGGVNRPRNEFPPIGGRGARRRDDKWNFPPIGGRGEELERRRREAKSQVGKPKSPNQTPGDEPQAGPSGTRPLTTTSQERKGNRSATQEGPPSRAREPKDRAVERRRAEEEERARKKKEISFKEVLCHKCGRRGHLQQQCQGERFRFCRTCQQAHERFPDRPHWRCRFGNEPWHRERVERDRYRAAEKLRKEWLG